jgi:hypothetical protein
MSRVVIETFGALPPEEDGRRVTPHPVVRLSAEDRQPLLPMDLRPERWRRTDAPPGGTLQAPVKSAAVLEPQVLYVPAPTPVQDVVAPPRVVQTSPPAPAPGTAPAPQLPGAVPSGTGGILAQVGRWMDQELVPGVANKWWVAGLAGLVVLVAVLGRGRD